MKSLNAKIEEPEAKDEVAEEKPKKEQSPKSPKKNGLVSVLKGDILVKDKFVKLFPFFIYVVALLMLCIWNTYVAEDINREIADLVKKEENLYVEYVYYKSEITKHTKQSNLVKKLEKKGIKESVVPLRKIVYEKEGGRK